MSRCVFELPLVERGDQLDYFPCLAREICLLSIPPWNCNPSAVNFAG